MRDALERLVPLPDLMIRSSAAMRWRRDCRAGSINSSSSATFWRAGDGMARSCPVAGEVISDGPLSAAKGDVYGNWRNCCGMRTVGANVPGTVIRWSFPILLQQRLVASVTSGDGGACRRRTAVGWHRILILIRPVGRITACGVQEQHKLDISEFRGSRSLQIIDDIWPL